MLKSVLFANAMSCLGFGALFLIAPSSVSEFLGQAPVWIVIVLGLGLIANGAHLLWAAREDMPSRGLVMYFVAGDFGWVLATVVLIGSGIWITTMSGIVASLIVAIWVALCGIGQFAFAPALAKEASQP